MQQLFGLSSLCIFSIILMHRPTTQNMAAELDRSFTDRLLFVHHDADNLKTLPRRRRVFSHIQERYRPWKRQEDAQEPKPLIWKEPMLSTSGRQSRKEKQRSDEDHPCKGQLSQLGAMAVVSPSRPTSPQTLMGKGNSDPFNVFSVSIDPDENNLIGLYRDYILPLMYHLSTGYKIIHELAARDWQDNIAGLKEQGTALGTLALYGAIASRGNANMQPVALNFLGQSVRSLREKMS
jgi:hypothetical protein